MLRQAVEAVGFLPGRAEVKRRCARAVGFAGTEKPGFSAEDEEQGIFNTADAAA
ncbi:MAG TPA: hypothetical protein VE842_09475 [Pyrinomonadaceae bacterium]|jgi:hypothetical protein|nr:hypothetical protein [Pyrinomonadaceae bacterium]